MKTYLLLAALFLLVFPVFASAQDRVVDFQKDQACCRLIWKDGAPYLFIDDGSIHVGIGAPTYTPYDTRLYSLLVYVKNDGDNAIEVNPSQFSAFASDSNHSPLEYVDMDQLAAHDYKHSTFWNSFRSGLGAAAASMSGTQTATITSSDGTTSTVTYNNPAAVANAVNNVYARQAQRQQRIADRFNSTTGVVLRHNTLSKDMQIIGSVSFRGPKNMKPFGKGAQIDYVDIRIGDTIYRFRG